MARLGAHRAGGSQCACALSDPRIAVAIPDTWGTHGEHRLPPVDGDNRPILRTRSREGVLVASSESSPASMASRWLQVSGVLRRQSPILSYFGALADQRFGPLWRPPCDIAASSPRRSR